MKKKRLDSLRIERFRQIRELSIPELGHVNLVVGGNNSGKSTLLDALRFYAAKASPVFLEGLLAGYGELDSGQNSGNALIPGGALGNLFFGRRFPSEDDAAIYVGDMSGERFVRLEDVWRNDELPDREAVRENRTTLASATGRGARKISKRPSLALAGAYRAIEISYKEKKHGQPSMMAIPLADLFRPGDFWRVGLSSLLGDPIPHGYVPSRQGYANSLAEAWDSVVLTESESLAVRSLQIIEPRTQGLAFVQLRAAQQSADARIAVVKIPGVDSPVPLQSMGDGMARVLRLVLSALQARDGLFLVDEFENGLHYSVQAKVWEILFDLAQVRGVQIFATTHSSDCVRAFCQVAKANTEVDGKLLKLERMPDDGQTVAATLGEDDLSNLLDADIEVRG